MVQAKSSFLTLAALSCIALVFACAAPPPDEAAPTTDSAASDSSSVESEPVVGESEPPTPAPLTDADPPVVRVGAAEDNGNCVIRVVPGTVDLCRTADPVCANAATWKWVGDKGNFTHIYFVVKDVGLNQCLSTTDIGGGKKGFEITRLGTDKSVLNGCAGPAEYAYGILAKRSSGADCTYDPKVKILD